MTYVQDWLLSLRHSSIIRGILGCLRRIGRRSWGASSEVVSLWWAVCAILQRSSEWGTRCAGRPAMWHWTPKRAENLTRQVLCIVRLCPARVGAIC